jgi:hypothetical protein
LPGRCCAPADDDVLGSTSEVDEAIGVDAGKVAGVEPAVVQLAHGVDNGPARALLDDVSGEDGGALDGQHPNLACGQVGPGAVVVDPNDLRLLIGRHARA